MHRDWFLNRLSPDRHETDARTRCFQWGSRFCPGPLLLCIAIIVPLIDPVRSVAQDELRHNSGQLYLTPEETVRRFRLHDGFEARVFAAEPDLANPIAMCFDERGRFWVIECFEYPKGTPPGEKPKDRIKIFEDTDGDHRADTVKVFAEGFNLATGIAVGHGGVFVGQAPDLLFLKDTDGDDRADTRDVLLTGFGRQDTHELLNTFTWGPDGWLYGCHGVFTHSNVKPPDADASHEPPIEMNAAVWRYHPRTRQFEIFAEGTSNPWGIDFDQHGNMFLTACVIPHLFHIVPGGRYIRQAGQNRNPYDFGQLKEISDHRHHEESGWAHAGCVVLDGEIWPEDLRGSVIFGSIHGNSIKRDVLRRNGSTFVASHVPDFLMSDDKNFRPVHQEIGPDGAIYIIDWHDQWPCHQTPPDAWEKERGRVYKVVARDAKAATPRDMGTLSNEQLAEELNNPNPYVYRTARRLLDERQARPIAAVLKDSLLASNGERRPESELRWLWAIGSLDELDEETVLRLLAHPNELVRAWTLRLLGEPASTASPVSRTEAPATNDRKPRRSFRGDNTLYSSFGRSGRLRDELVRIARFEKSPAVRLQLAATCQRLDARSVFNAIHELTLRDEDSADPALPLMAWFAYEPYLVGNDLRTFRWLQAHAAEHEIVSRDILPRVMRRLAATGKSEDMAGCIRFAASAENAKVRHAALDGLATALEGRRVPAPADWAEVRAKLMNDSDAGVQKAVRRLGANFRDRQVIREAEVIALDATVAAPDRTDAIRAIAVARLPESLEALEKLLAADGPPELRHEVLRALGGYDSQAIAPLVIGQFKSLSGPLQAEALTLLTGRREWADALLSAISEGHLGRDDLSAPAAQRIAALKDPQLVAKLEKTWGSVRQQTPAEIEQLIRRLRRVVAADKGDASAGRSVYEKKCAVCHKFNGVGADVGPDITGADRSVEYLLINILDPNRVVGQPYYTHVIATKDGRVISGKLVSSTPDSITLEGENNKRDVLPRDEIEEYVVKNLSVMPEGLPQDMTEEQFRDLIAYLRRN